MGQASGGSQYLSIFSLLNCTAAGEMKGGEAEEEGKEEGKCQPGLGLSVISAPQLSDRGAIT